jgi:hypothetical protein
MMSSHARATQAETLWQVPARLIGYVAMPSTVRFLREYFRSDPAAVEVADTTYERPLGPVPATVYRPRDGDGRLPGWVVLHGLTFTGREHPSLIRFARAVAAAGNVVFVPEIPEWRQLRVAPAITVETIRSAVRALQSRDDVDHEHAGLFGFSFGATQALIAATDPDVAKLLHGLCSWGGYHDLERLFVFAMTGEHELDGVTYHTKPDPYGGWVMAGNYLTSIPGHEEHGDLAEAFHTLAREAGRRQIYAWEPVFDSVKVEVRAMVPPEQHALFDLVAPMSDAAPRDRDAARAIALALAEAVRRVDPLMDPQPFLGTVFSIEVRCTGHSDIASERLTGKMFFGGH